MKAKLYKSEKPGGNVAYGRFCFCIGPQNGDPLCPCRMHGVTIRDGRYVEIIDHGPAKPKLSK